MRCPYCSGEMKACVSTPYRGYDGVKLADWVRCARCSHATVREVRPALVKVSHQRELQACA